MQQGAHGDGECGDHRPHSVLDDEVGDEVARVRLHVGEVGRLADVDHEVEEVQPREEVEVEAKIRVRCPEHGAHLHGEGKVGQHAGAQARGDGLGEPLRLEQRAEPVLSHGKEGEDDEAHGLHHELSQHHHHEEDSIREAPEVSARRAVVPRNVLAERAVKGRGVGLLEGGEAQEVLAFVCCRRLEGLAAGAPQIEWGERFVARVCELLFPEGDATHCKLHEAGSEERALRLQRRLCLEAVVDVHALDGHLHDELDEMVGRRCASSRSELGARLWQRLFRQPRQELGPPDGAAEVEVYVGGGRIARGRADDSAIRVVVGGVHVLEQSSVGEREGAEIVRLGHEGGDIQEVVRHVRLDVARDVEEAQLLVVLDPVGERIGDENFQIDHIVLVIRRVIQVIDVDLGLWVLQVELDKRVIGPERVREHANLRELEAVARRVQLRERGVGLEHGEERIARFVWQLVLAQVEALKPALGRWERGLRAPRGRSRHARALLRGRRWRRERVGDLLD
mmetsp:Transcript_27764/g.74740  ORF Transcript_27764/g.74740 Transcript_27764/m.74740 type:complete len:509 (-) Transcript_27764:395-1921(-)